MTMPPPLGGRTLGMGGHVEDHNDIANMLPELWARDVEAELYSRSLERRIEILDTALLRLAYLVLVLGVFLVLALICICLIGDQSGFWA